MSGAPAQARFGHRRSDAYREFRFAYHAEDYEATVGFYEGVLDLGVVHRWDRGPDDKGTLFGAASGIIEILKLPSYAEFVPPRGAVVIEVDDVDAPHDRLRQTGLAIKQKPTDKPSGHRDLVLADPNGLVLVFFSPVEADGV
jgi:catechol 2,3-dioxygenase-like lactoylglutathione lyase family enzyme